MIYKLDNYELIQDVEISCEHELVEDMIKSMMLTDEFSCVELYANADIITDVLRILLNVDMDGLMFTLGIVNIDGKGIDYDLDYVLSINTDLSVWVEPALRYVDGNLKTIQSEAFLLYVHSQCNYRIIKNIHKNKDKALIFSFEDEDED